MGASHRTMAKIFRKMIGQDWRSHAGVRVGLYVIFAVISFFFLLNHINLHRYELRVGSVSPKDFHAPRADIDIQATEEARKEAEQAVDAKYTRDDHKTDLQRQRIDNLFARLAHNMADSSYTVQQKINQIHRDLDDFSRDAMKAPVQSGDPSRVGNDRLAKIIIQMPQEKLTELRFQARKIIEEFLNKGLRPTDLQQSYGKVLAIVEGNPDLDEDARVLVTELVQQSLVPNETYDEQMTLRLKRVARESISPIPILRGQLIVSKGAVITPDQQQKLKRFGYLSLDWRYMLLSDIGLFLFVIIIVLLLMGYSSRFKLPIAKDNHKLLLLLFIISLTVLMSKSLTLMGQEALSAGKDSVSGILSLGFASPVVFGAILATLLLDMHMGFLSALLSSIFVGIFFHSSLDSPQFPFDLHVSMSVFVGSAVAAMVLRRTSRRSRILKVGFLATVASWIPITAGYLMRPYELWTVEQWAYALMWGALGGIASAVLALGMLPYLETLFGVLSPMSLIELCNPSHPLLKRLLLKTPGTYHHSIMVANLAEVAAEAVGANGLLARVGSYYHDIGKIKRSRFFMENQLPGVPNPHNLLSPYLSRSIIHSHVREGVEILRQHRIPEPIRDIAAQHHGTTLLRFFYYQALRQADKNTVVSLEEFRYPGPKARSKEAAIVGIADCIEAATRSLQHKATPARLEEMVRGIVKDRLEDGQLDECDLTFRDLDRIVSAMTAVLQGIFHTRIAYPKHPGPKVGRMKP